jgi:hypothetical protein
MTLDPVHFDGIARLAHRIGQDVDDSDHDDFAERVWADFLDPLRRDGTTLLEPIDEQCRRTVPIEDVALAAAAYDTVHGLDAGSFRPTTFKNGVTIDLAHAAMSATPSDLELHRGRTVVAAVHSNDATIHLDDDWHMGDEGYFRSKMVHTPTVSRFVEQVVGSLALYLAESQHALLNADVVDELLVLDGPIYPKAMLRWPDRDPELAALLREEKLPRDAVRNYLRLVERFVERDVPLVGFVKNPISKSITRAVRSKGAQAPWLDDAAFFTRVLERGERIDGEWVRDEDHLTVTGWFYSRGGADRPLSREGDALGLDRALSPADYEVTFCAVYDPRDDLLYKIEAPAAFTREADRRERLTRHLLSAVATGGGPPLAIRKADELARISRDERRSLYDTFEEAFETERTHRYDEKRWSTT